MMFMVDLVLQLAVDPRFRSNQPIRSVLHFHRRHFLSRLNKLLAKQTISIKKADEIQVKVNILRAFVEGPQEDGEEKIRDTAEL